MERLLRKNLMEMGQRVTPIRRAGYQYLAGIGQDASPSLQPMLWERDAVRQYRFPNTDSTSQKAICFKMYRLDNAGAVMCYLHRYR